MSALQIAGLLMAAMLLAIAIGVLMRRADEEAGGFTLELATRLVDPGRIPDVAGTEPTCRCGALKIGPVRSTVQTVSIQARCVRCGDWLEAVATPRQDGAA
jgi:hypothetical protein